MVFRGVANENVGVLHVVFRGVANENVRVLHVVFKSC